MKRFVCIITVFSLILSIGIAFADGKTSASQETFKGLTCNAYKFDFSSDLTSKSSIQANTVQEATKYIKSLSNELEEFPGLEGIILKKLKRITADGGEIESMTIYIPTQATAKAAGETSSFGSYGGLKFQQVFSVFNTNKTKRVDDRPNMTKWVKGTMDLAMTFSSNPLVSLAYTAFGLVADADLVVGNGGYTNNVIRQEITSRTVLIEDQRGLTGGGKWFPIYSDEARACRFSCTIYPAAPHLKSRTRDSALKTKYTSGWSDANAIRKKCYETYFRAEPDTMIVKQLSEPTMKYVK